MFLTQQAFKKADIPISKGNYAIVVNPIKQNYSKIEDLKGESLPNYLIVNVDTLAIEFGVDQFPSAFEIMTKLYEEMCKISTKVKDTIQ